MDITEKYVFDKINETYSNIHDTELLKSVIVFNIQLFKITRRFKRLAKNANSIFLNPAYLDNLYIL